MKKEDKSAYRTGGERTVAAEPMAATLSEGVRRSGLLGQVMSLSPSDKMALVRYLKQDVEEEQPFSMDSVGRVVLTRDMREAVRTAEQSYEAGECLMEDGFQQRFAKWL